jgi:hypothetical protein
VTRGDNNNKFTARGGRFYEIPDLIKDPLLGDYYNTIFTKYLKRTQVPSLCTTGTPARPWTTGTWNPHPRPGAKKLQ